MYLVPYNTRTAVTVNSSQFTKAPLPPDPQVSQMSGSWCAHRGDVGPTWLHARVTRPFCLVLLLGS
jgi:hypothetical protein